MKLCLAQSEINRLGPNRNSFWNEFDNAGKAPTVNGHAGR
jgi:hypothetical protein